MSEFDRNRATIIVSALVEVAKHYLPPFSFPIEISFERIGEGTFSGVQNGCVVRGHTIIVNQDWFATQDEKDSQDIKYIIWHEVRHLYQKDQIEIWKSNGHSFESSNTIRQWEYEYVHYVSLGPGAEERHFNQEIELDAYSFSLALLFIHCAQTNGSINIGLPPMIETVLMERCEKFIQTLPSPRYKAYSVEPNQKCPCESGKKYKKCCRQKGYFF